MKWYTWEVCSAEMEDKRRETAKRQHSYAFGRTRCSFGTDIVMRQRNVGIPVGNRDRGRPWLTLENTVSKIQEEGHVKSMRTSRTVAFGALLSFTIPLGIKRESSRSSSKCIDEKPLPLVLNSEYSKRSIPVSLDLLNFAMDFNALINKI